MPRSPTARSGVPLFTIDPRVSLAMAMHSGPGVHAVLLGSGISSAAGIPTGWQVVQDLLRRVGRAEGINEPGLEDEPELWWKAAGRGEPRFDDLVGGLAGSAPARTSLLRDYFDPPASKGGALQPTEAHHALARLAASGRVRVIITTNFDRLMEQALERVGVRPQVIATDSAVRGMTPLVHAPVTLLKPNGDYASPGLRMTSNELESYPGVWRRVLRQIFDEYGLLVIGWSADYDVALADILQGTASRRYPTYWTALRGRLRPAAANFIAQRRASVVEIRDADEFTLDLEARLARLDILAARRERATFVSQYLWSPEGSFGSAGWEENPLLWLRVTGSIGPATSEDVDYIGPEYRAAILNALPSAQLTSSLYELSIRVPSSAVTGEAVVPTPVEPWQLTPGVRQTGSHASFRFGGPALRGVSALLRVDRPGATVGGSVRVTVDVGVSVRDRVSLLETTLAMARAMRLGLIDVPDLIDPILPADARMRIAELYIAALRQGMARDSRPNTLTDRVDMSSLGAMSGDVWSMQAAVALPDQLTPAVVMNIFLQSLERMVLNEGFVDPRTGLASLGGVLRAQWRSEK